MGYEQEEIEQEETQSNSAVDPEAFEGVEP